MEQEPKVDGVEESVPVGAYNKNMETLGGRRCSAKGRRRYLTRCFLGSSGFSLCTYCSFRDMVWN